MSQLIMWHIAILQYLLLIRHRFVIDRKIIFPRQKSTKSLKSLQYDSFEKYISTSYVLIYVILFIATTFNVNNHSEEHLSICDHVNLDRWRYISKVGWCYLIDDLVEVISCCYLRAFNLFRIFSQMNYTCFWLPSFFCLQTTTLPNR